MGPGGAWDQGREFSVFLPESLPPAGDDLAVGSEGLKRGSSSVLFVEVEDFHAMFCDVGMIELAQALEHVIGPPKAFNFIKDAPDLHDLILTL